MANKEKGPTHMIGAPALGRTSNGIPGTRVIACERCEQPTLFAPSSLAHEGAAAARFICIDCACALTIEAGEAPVVLAPSDAQRKEFLAAMKASQ